jgi:hypothetical protein
MISPDAALDAALAESDQADFLDALMNLDPRFADVEPDLRPEPLKKFACLAILHQDAHHEGIWKFLSQEEGRTFGTTLEYCRELRAERAVAYLESVAGLYPRRRVPVDLEKRSIVVERLEREAQASGSPDPFRALDKRYGDAMPELADALRQWIIANRATIDALLTILPAPACNELGDIEELKGVLRTLQAAVARKEGTWAVTHAKLSDAARARGMLPWNPAENLATTERFFAGVVSLTDEDWKTVADRRLAHPRIANRHEKVRWHVLRVIRETDLVDRELFRPVRERVSELIRSLDARFKAMPEQDTHAGRPLGLRHGAFHAFAEVMRALYIHDWMVLTPAGERAAHAAYAFFEGLAPCPEISLQAKPVKRQRHSR